MTTTWFTSDEHYGHKNIIVYSNRPFGSVEEMTERLISNHNNRVRPGDTVFHLGDFTFSSRLLEAVLPRLNGAHYLVCGNHDRCHPMHKKHEAEKARYVRAGFKDVFTELQLGSEVAQWPLGNLVAAHMPYSGDHYEGQERYAQWRPKDEGRVLLHGHVHEAWKVRGRMVNVGVDVWGYTPVSAAELQAFIRENVK
jgi:calcineurin-like phosphoesterase family protein